MRWHSANCSTDELSEPAGPELNGFILEESPDSTLFLKADTKCLSRRKVNYLLLLNTSYHLFTSYFCRSSHVHICVLSVKDVASSMRLECECFASKSVERWQFGERVTSERAQILSWAFHFFNASCNFG